ncbi:MAG: NAD(P)/FAD-dependent oxidoreductase [Gemmatimonadetes bacterium]|nr:NAD(P)/FAD-dependent oxidoreductase [Gemmatimonadota bacterium]
MALRVVVVGAGFGGLWATRHLVRGGARVTLIDQRNYHTFFPLLYQVAAAELGPTSIGYPIRSVLRDMKDVEFRLGRVTSLNLADRAVTLADGTSVPYETLLLSPGSVTHYFGVPGAQDHAFPLRWMNDALELRRHILTRFEYAARAEGEDRGRALTFIIVGGGATGVEYAGALAELVFGPVLADFPEFRKDELHILLVEGQDRVLGAMHPDLSAYAASRLASRGVELRLGAHVESVDAGGVVLTDGARLEGDTVVWTAGVRGDPVFTEAGLKTGRGGRVVVEPTLQARGWPDVFVAGDLAYIEHEGEPVPQVAPAAMQLGEAAAANILRRGEGARMLDFRYQDPGMMAVIGRYAAVAEIGGYRGGGLFAWVMWALIHIAKLIGFRSRLLVLVNWAWNYLSFRRAVRLILPDRVGDV